MKRKGINAVAWMNGLSTAGREREGRVAMKTDEKEQGRGDCQQCGRFPGEFEDPTFRADRTLLGVPLWICAGCAKGNIEDEMRRQSLPVN